MIPYKVEFLALLIAMCFAAAGCQPYVEEFEYLPHPAIVEMGAHATNAASQPAQPLTVYATVVGVRREDPKAHLPLSVETRLRFDSASSNNIEFDPRTLELLAGDLFRFAPPIVEPTSTVALGAGRSASLTVYFPFPRGTSYQHVRMGTLLLHWRVRIGGQLVPQSARFHRIDPDYVYDPLREVWGNPYNLGYPFVGGNAEVQYPE